MASYKSTRGISLVQSDVPSQKRKAGHGSMRLSEEGRHFGKSGKDIKMPNSPRLILDINCSLQPLPSTKFS
jgi:hypothetical protein